jgi:hypothetical protein
MYRHFPKHSTLWRGGASYVTCNVTSYWWHDTLFELHLLMLLSLSFNRNNKKLLCSAVSTVWIVPWLYGAHANHAPLNNHFIHKTLQWYIIDNLANWKAHVGWGSAVGIATCYRLHSLGIKSQWGQDFPHLSRLPPGTTQPPKQWVLGLLLKIKQPGCGADRPPLSSAEVKEEYGYTPIPYLGLCGLF